MLNIHQKIEAKKVLSQSVVALIQNELFTPSKLLNSIYEVFSKDLFLLPYKVQKLSKKAKRDTGLHFKTIKN
jgi:hypothetical protein